MPESSVREPEAERDRLYAQLSHVGDFRCGSVSENYRGGHGAARHIAARSMSRGGDDPRNLS